MPRGPWRGLGPASLCGAVLAAPAAADEAGVRRLELWCARQPAPAASATP
jgi:hypothetical protein